MVVLVLLTLEIAEDPLESFLDTIYLQSHSEKSRRAYRININKFRRFIVESYHLDDIELVKRIQEKDLDVFDVLRKFVVYLDKSGKSPATIKLCLAAVKGYLRHQKIKIYSEDFKQNVRLPKKVRTREEPMTKEILVRLLHILPLKLQAAVLVGCSSGMRLGEIIQLKIGDVDFSCKPVRIQIRAETTKTRESRETYLTSEAAISLKDYLSSFFGWVDGQQNNLLKDQVIFGPTRKSKQNSRKLEASQRAESTIIGSLKGYVKKITELNRLNENGRRVIHFHAFRKYFRTVVGDAVGRDYAEALMGHHFYMDTYYNLPVEKRREMYLKAEPHLTISDFEKIERNQNRIVERQMEIEEALAKLGIKFSTDLEKDLSRNFQSMIN